MTYTSTPRAIDARLRNSANSHDTAVERLVEPLDAEPRAIKHANWVIYWTLARWLIRSSRGSGLREGDLEEDQRLLGRDDNRIRDIEAGSIDQGHIVLKVEEEVAMNRAHRRNDIGV